MTTPNPAPVTTSDAERAAFTDQELIELCEKASIPWFAPDLENDNPDDGGFPGSFDMVPMRQMRRLVAVIGAALPTAKPPALRIDFKQATEQGAWQLVPKEPTPAMLHAMWQDREAFRGQSENKTARHHYALLLASAPKHPSPQPEEGSLFLGVADGDAVGGKSGGDA